MPFYRPISFIVFLVFISLSTFFFIEDQDTMAKQVLFFGIYIYIGLFFLLKSLYYLRHSATFNELFFVVGLPILPPLFAILGVVTEVNDLFFSELLTATLTVSGESTEYSLFFASLLSLPYFLFSIYLLLRTFIRYEFLRWRAHSTGGPPGTLIGLILALGIGILYLIVGVIFSDLLLALFGFIYALNGILGFLA